jgi:hypothetical protein
MTPSPRRPEIGEALKASLAYAARSRQGLAAGWQDARELRLRAPPSGEHVRRFLYGLIVPVTLLRVAWAHAPTRRRMAQCLSAPLLCVALSSVIGVGWTVAGALHPDRAEAAVHASDDDDDPDEPGAKVIDVKGLRLKIDGARAASAAASVQPAAGGRFSAIRTALHVLQSRVVKVLGALGVIEWILVWIGREHQDWIAYETSILTGVPGEEPPAPPRLRLDAGWLRLKLWRAIRFVLFLALGAPVGWLVGKIPFAGAWLGVAIEGAWTIYWADVFAIANTFLAWEPLAPGEAPWFIRVLEPIARIPVVGLPARLYARVLAFATRKVWPACMAFERTPWESTGLATARAIASVPLVYLVLRPMFGPAATHALIARRSSDAADAVREASLN